MIYPINKIHWRQTPSIKILLFFIPGIIIGENFSINLNQLLIGSICILFSLFYLSRLIINTNNKFLFNSFYAIIIFILGLILINFNIKELKEKPAENKFIAVIINQEIKTNSNQLILNIKYTKDEKENIKKINHTAIAYVSDKSRIFKVGQYLFINKSLTTIKKPENPKSFNYKEYLLKKGIYHQLYLKESEYNLIDKIDYKFYHSIKNIQKKLINLINNSFSSSNQSGLISAMILGYRSGMDSETKSNFSTSGLTHILAVSGLHIGIIFVFLYQLIGRWKLKSAGKVIQYFSILFMIWIYISLTGSSPSAIRAGILCTLLIGAKLINRKGNILNHLGIAALLLLSYNPYLIYDIGFQLSFAAVWGIVYFQNPIFNTFRPKTKIGFYFWKITSTSIAAQLTTAPICLLNFHQIPIYFWLSGLIGLPLAPFILGLGILFLISIHLIPSVTFIFQFLLDQVTRFLLVSVDTIAALPGNHLGKEISLSNFDYIFIGILFLSLIGFKETRNKNWIIIAFITAFCFSNHSINNKTDTTITFYSNKESIHIDIFSPKGNYYLSNATKAQSKKAVQYFLSPWRIEHGIKSNKIKQVHLEDSNFDEGLMYHAKIALLPISSFMLIDKKEKKSSIQVDVVLISGKNIYPKDIDLGKIKLLILDKTLSAKQARAWEKWSSDLDIPYCNMYKEGAIWLTIKRDGISVQSMKHTFTL